MESQLENETVNQNDSVDESSFGVSIQPSISREEDATEMQGKAEATCYVPLCGLVFCVMGFLGLFSVFTQRVSLSVAIVAMVNQTAVSDDGGNMTNATNSSSTDQCPRDEALQHEDGEFTWDRHQQAAALAVFSYGQVISQVCIIIIIIIIIITE